MCIFAHADNPNIHALATNISNEAKKTNHPEKQKENNTNEIDKSTGKKEPLFILSNKPPPGFEALTRPQQTMVDVYYQGLYVHSVMATYTPTTLKFESPAQLVALLPGLSSRPKVSKALTGKLPIHANLVCSTQQRKNNECKTLKLKIAGVIFNSANFRADVYIASPYVENSPIPNRFLPHSDSGLSYIQNLDAIVSGSIDGKSDKSYNLIANSVLSYNEARLNFSASYADNDTDVENNKDVMDIGKKLRINRLNAEVDRDQRELSLGLINTTGSILIPDQPIFGIRYATTLNTIKNVLQDEGTKLIIFLDSKSQVSIYRDGRLLDSKMYPPGNQALNTADLPSGAYNIILKIRGQDGGTHTEQRFFVKTSMIPPMEFPQFSMSAGWLQANSSKNDCVFPKITNIPIFSINGKKRIGNSWGLSASLLGDNHKSYLSLGAFLIGSNYQVTSQMMVSTNNDLGASIGTELNLGNLNLGLNAQRRWAKNYIDTETENTDNKFNPITNSSTQTGATLSYHISGIGISFSAQMSHADREERQYSYGPSINFTPFSLFNTPVNIELNAIRSQNDTTLYMQMSMNFYSQSGWTTNIELDHKRVDQRNIDIDDINNTSGNSGSISVDKQWYNAQQSGYSIRAIASHEGKSNTISAGGNYHGDLGRANISISHNIIKDSPTNTQYVVSYANQMVFSNNGVAFSGASDSDTGVVVEVKSNVNKKKFDVLVDGQVVKTIKTNIPTTIDLIPFNTHRISIRSASETFFSYSQAPKEVTVYQGNYKTLIWHARQKIIVFSHIIYPNGKPVKDALIKGGAGLNATDEAGDLQAEILEDTGELTAVDINGKSCIIKLPTLAPENGLVELKTLACYKNAL